MSELWEEYPHLMEAYEKMPRQINFRQEFEAGWGKALSLVTAAKDKAVAEAAAPAREMEALLSSLRGPFAKEPGAAPQGPNQPPAAFARGAGGFCRSCGFQLNPAAAFCKSCGAKIR